MIFFPVSGGFICWTASIPFTNRLIFLENKLVEKIKSNEKEEGLI